MNNSGSIFPVFDISNNKNENPSDPFTGGLYPTPDVGLSLRDYFAAAVVMGICARTCVDLYEDYDQAEIADRAFEIADVMLERRKK
jgi:hypothetical protein